ncbi:MAG: hypothetical protein U0325_23265 [Polyangiales bacterium]
MRDAAWVGLMFLVGCARTVSSDPPAMCPAASALRPLRPLTSERATTPTPTFRWRADPELRDLRLRHCDDRACLRGAVEVAVSGDRWTPPTALPPGTRFWSLSARDARGARVRSAVRAVTIPSTESSGACLQTLADFDGDGIEEQVTATAAGVRVRYGSGRADTEIPASAARQPVRSPCAPGLLITAATLSAAGDLDGDGFVDAVLQERRTEAACPDLDPVYVRRYALYRGSPEGLREAAPTLPEDRAENVWVSSRIDPVGDLDDDGFADLARARTSELLGRCAPDFGTTVLFGGPGACLTPGTSRISAPGGAAAVCDVDGDGVEELGARDGDAVFALYAVTGRRLRPLVLPARCGDVELHFYDRCIPGVERPEADLRPLGDLDRDGYGDVESLLFDRPNATGPRGAVVFFGAPGGFREDRCALRP